MLSATEPDVLLFEDLPQAVGADPVRTKIAATPATYQPIAEAVASAMSELSGAYPELTSTLMESLMENLRPDGADVHGSLVRRSTELRDKILDPRVKALATACRPKCPIRTHGWRT